MSDSFRLVPCLVRACACLWVRVCLPWNNKKMTPLFPPPLSPCQPTCRPQAHQVVGPPAGARAGVPEGARRDHQRHPGMYIVYMHVCVYAEREGGSMDWLVGGWANGIGRMHVLYAIGEGGGELCIFECTRVRRHFTYPYHRAGRRSAAGRPSSGPTSRYVLPEPNHPTVPNHLSTGLGLIHVP